MNLTPRRSLQPTLLLAVVFLAATLLPAQQPVNAVPDNALFSAFFAFQAAAAHRAAAVQANDPARAAVMQRSMSNLLHISPAGQSVVAAVSRSVAQRLQDLSAETRQYFMHERDAGRRPDRIVMRTFAARRQVILQDGQTQLKQSLSPADWTALSTYIHNEFGSHVHAYPLNR